MAVELPILSFTCAALLAVFIPVRRTRMSVPSLAIISWLVGYNLVHGINALVWDGNADIHVPVWCDIVTKLMLGANIALPGAFLSISRQLELVSSSRTISLDKKVIRNRMVLELLLCYVMPIIYMSLHVVAQDHRFDLVKDFGCSASIHPSTFAFLIVWIPPLLLCSISLILSGIAIHNAFRLCSSRFTLHVESRSTMTSSIFVRRLVICMIMTGAVSLISIFSLFSVPIFQPWVSWDSVHAAMSQVDVIASSDEIKSIQVAWWGVFAVSTLYILLVFILGQETRDAYKWIREQVSRKREFPKLVLPVYRSKEKQHSPDMVCRSPSLTKPQLRPLTIELKSGWDDMLDRKTHKRKPSHKNLSPFVCSSPTPSNRSDTESSSRSVAEEDQAFMESTLSYLGSPTAKSLGIATPLKVPPAVHSPPPRSALEIPPKPASPPPVPIQKAGPKQPIPADAPAPSSISSVFDASWPIPPDSPVSSPSPSPHGSPTRSPLHSPASSAEETFGYPLYPTITPPHLRTRPFEGSSISSIGEVVPPSPPAVTSPRKSAMKRPSIRNLRRSLSKERLGQNYVTAEVIHMTVVQETV